MDPNDIRRLEHASQTLAKGREAVPNDPAQALYLISSALTLRATVLVKQNSLDADAGIRHLVNDVQALHAELGIPIPLTQKNNLMILALAQGEIDAARKLARLESTADSYPFTQALSNFLVAGVGVGQLVRSNVEQVEESESLLLSDLALIANGQSTELSDTDKFWSRTRCYRFSNTIHEHRNFFRPALQTLQANRAE